MLDASRRIVVDASASSTRFKDADFVYHLNEAGNDFARRTKCLEVRSSPFITTVVGQREYILPSDFYEMRQLIYDPSATRLFLTPTVNTAWEIDKGTTGQPYMYHIWRDRLSLLPSPQEVKIVDGLYWGLPNELTATDPGGAMSPAERAVTMTIPSRFHYSIVRGAASFIFSAFEDPTQYTSYIQQYENDVSRAAQEMKARFDGQPLTPFQGDFDVFGLAVPGLGVYDQ